MSYKSPSLSTAAQADPANSGLAVRRAFLIESFFNFLSFPLITNPRFCLSLLLNHPSQINPATIFWTRLFGGLVVGCFAPILLMGYPNTRTAIEIRRPVYIMLGLGEMTIIPLLLNEFFKGGKGDAALTPLGAAGAVLTLATPFVWRLYTLFVRPEMLGKYKEVKRA